MRRIGFAGKIMALFFCISGGGMMACYARANVGEPVEECRTVEVRNPHDVEVCRERCTENGCREHCVERERWSRQHRCWVE